MRTTKLAAVAVAASMIVSIAMASHEAFHTYSGVIWTVYKRDTGQHFKKGDKFRIYKESGDIYFVPGRQMTDAGKAFHNSDKKFRLQTMFDAKGDYLCARDVKLHDGTLHVIGFRVSEHQTTMEIRYEHQVDDEGKPKANCSDFNIHGGRAHAEN